MNQHWLGNNNNTSITYAFCECTRFCVDVLCSVHIIVSNLVVVTWLGPRRELYTTQYIIWMLSVSKVVAAAQVNKINKLKIKVKRKNEKWKLEKDDAASHVSYLNRLPSFHFYMFILFFIFISLLSLVHLDIFGFQYQFRCCFELCHANIHEYMRGVYKTTTMKDDYDYDWIIKYFVHSNEPGIGREIEILNKEKSLVRIGLCGC